MLGKTTEHHFRVIKGLNEPVILGADFINKHLLLYDPKYKRVKWRHENDWAISPIKTATESEIEATWPDLESQRRSACAAMAAVVL